jgi:N6-L-threonylcarbamoyladenine synthase
LFGNEDVAESSADTATAGLLLAIESSCDETAAAVVDCDLNVLSNVVASQAQLHERFGGVVPEIASRAHLRAVLPVIDEALAKADCRPADLTAIAVVTQPGLVGSLLVGLTAAKTLAAVLKIPLIAVNHIEAHLYACRMAAGFDVFPAVGLVVSGGHSNLYHCKAAIDFELIGSTIDDAAGEAFDKVAQMLGLGYPGGPAIDVVAREGNAKAFKFPRTFLREERLDFSFSGLKTAVLYEVNGIPGSHSAPPPKLTEQRIADVAASFQQAVVDVLVAKCRQAARQYGLKRLLVGGGVAANSQLRQGLDELQREEAIDVIVAPMEYCTDNAAMAAIAWELYGESRFAALDVDVTPGLVRRGRR